MSPKEYKDKINAAGTEITVLSTGNDDDYISLTDIARKRDGEYPKKVSQMFHEALTSWVLFLYSYSNRTRHA